MPSIDTSSFKKGLALLWKNEPHVIIDYQKVNPGKGSAFSRTKLRNCITGNVFEVTFKASEKIELADLTRKNANYSYADEDNFYFMDQASYELVAIPKEVVGDNAKYLIEETKVIVMYYNENPISIEIKPKIDYKVVDAPEAVKGDTATNAMKTVKLENGLEIQAPLFIKAGDVVRVNTDTGQYVERVN